jgi:hypothetical protein
MARNILSTALLLTLALTSGAVAAPVLSVIPQGLQGGNWVWQVNITPDLAAAGGSTPIAEEIGFRLTGDPLVNVTSLSPAIMDTNLPGLSIFGWETTYGSPARPEGIEANCAGCTVTNLAVLGGHASTVVSGSANEIFTAMGSIDYGLPTPIPFLRITAQGPGSGGPSSSTIQWLGAYLANGRIAQIVGTNAQNFDIFSGTATQSVPEPSALLLVSAAVALLGTNRRFGHRRVA